ncbi:MAG: AAA family ATPase [Acidobacteria bacterium]|nr:AAA family ATPase [Acidobacteriota bacterium]
MKIKQLKIEGFRSLKNVTWEPGDLNILIGPNGTGKSNLLRFLELMAASAKGELGKYIQSLGGMGTIIWDGQAKDISFSLTSSGENDFIVDELYELRLARIVHSSVYLIDHEVLADREKKDSLRQIQYIKRSRRTAQIREDSSDDVQEIKPENLNEQETILSATSNIFGGIGAAFFKAYLSSFAVYHDIAIHQDSEIRRPSVSRLEKRVDSDGQNLINVLHTLYTTDREFERNIDTAMRAAFGSDYEKLVFPPAADQLIQLRVRWKTLKREQSAADLSDGTLRFLLLLTVLASPDPPPVIAIDEPEVGLHPAMLPIIAEYAVDATLRAQVILTTHSPQLLDAFTDKNPTTTVAKWQDGETVLQNLSGDDLAYWLKEYTLGTLFKSGELERMV